MEAARAKLRAAEANELKTRQDLDRLSRLYNEDHGTISIRRLEISQASVDQAEAQVRAAEADVKRAIEQMGGDGKDNTLLKTALTGVEKAQLDLANSVVAASTASAPWQRRRAERAVHRGQLPSTHCAATLQAAALCPAQRPRGEGRLEIA